MTGNHDNSREKYLRLAAELRARAAALPAGPERDALVKEARSAESASHMEDWASSPGLRPPKS